MHVFLGKWRWRNLPSFTGLLNPKKEEGLRMGATAAWLQDREIHLDHLNRRLPRSVHCGVRKRTPYLRGEDEAWGANPDPGHYAKATRLLFFSFFLSFFFFTVGSHGGTFGTGPAQPPTLPPIEGRHYGPNWNSCASKSKIGGCLIYK